MGKNFKGQNFKRINKNNSRKGLLEVTYVNMLDTKSPCIDYQYRDLGHVLLGFHVNIRSIPVFLLFISVATCQLKIN